MKVKIIAIIGIILIMTSCGTLKPTASKEITSKDTNILIQTPKTTRDTNIIIALNAVTQDGRIYYSVGNKLTSSAVMYRMKTDGTERQIVI